MSRFIKVVAALGICLASLLGHAETSGAQQNPVTAIDIALEPDQTMMLKRIMPAYSKPSRKVLPWIQLTIRTSRCCSSSSARLTSKRSTPL